MFGKFRRFEALKWLSKKGELGDAFCGWRAARKQASSHGDAVPFARAIPGRGFGGKDEGADVSEERGREVAETRAVAAAGRQGAKVLAA